MAEDLTQLAHLQDELEGVLLARLAEFVQEHPEANSARFAVAVFLSLAGRVGLTHLDPEATAQFMETTAAAVRNHGKGSVKILSHFFATIAGP